MKPGDSKRSSHWPALRRAFLKNKRCAVCDGVKKLEAHHILPFHTHPELELDETNLIALCEGRAFTNCHLFVGHLGNYKGYNPDVGQDSALWRAKIIANKKRIA